VYKTKSILYWGVLFMLHLGRLQPCLQTFYSAERVARGQTLYINSDIRKLCA
jgi:hypothetical protein